MAGNGGGGASGPPPTSDANCGNVTVGLNKVPPDVLIVLDRSGSMNDTVVGGTSCPVAPCSRWDETTSAINKVLAATQDTIRWGIKFYPDGGGGASCQVLAGAGVPIADNNAAAITAAIALQNPGGRTPTRAAELAGAAYLMTVQDPNPKFILLATDGIPNCIPDDPGGATEDNVGAIAAVGEVAGMGIPTFVVGVATAATPADMTLSGMATAGGRPRQATPPYYPVTTSDDLVAALSTIGGQIASCNFGLGRRPPDISNIAVNGGGMRIPRDTTHMNGWDYGTGEMSITLYGSYCEKAKAGQLPDVQAIFGCPGVVIP